jgi:putative transcriptional regulator
MISNNLSALLGRKLLKISKISKETGISRTTLTNLYYRRTKYITFEVLDALCAYLGCGVSELFEYVPESQPEAES